MELTKEFIEENKLSEEQVTAVTGHFANDVLPNLKKEWDGKANTDAEGILSGASKYGASKFGVSVDREQGEKWGDFLQRITDVGFSAKEKEYADKSKALEDKLKNFQGDAQMKQALEDEKEKNDSLLATIAELEPLKGLDEKFKTATEQLQGLKLSVAFNNIKPNFPKEANTYEANAKWEAFKSGVLAKYNVELVDNEPIAVDKENHHKTLKLSDLLDADNDIKELLKGRQQTGTGGKAVDLVDIEGVPFKVPQGASSEEQSKLAKEHLVKKLGDPLHPNFAKEMLELLIKMKKSA